MKNKYLFCFCKKCLTTRILRVIAIAVLISFVVGCHNQARDNMEAMIKRAHKQFSPRELQVAVTTVCATNDSEVDVADLPREIFALSDAKPNNAILIKNGGEKGTLLVTWGGAMQSWGIGVCPPGGRLDTNIRAQISRWSDGVFFFYDNE
jgi:hypothetical protein